MGKYCLIFQNIELSKYWIPTWRAFTPFANSTHIWAFTKQCYAAWTMGANLSETRKKWPPFNSPKSPHHKRVERQTKAQELTRCHLLRWSVPSCRTSVTYLGGMPVLKYSSMRLTSAGEKIFFSINRKGTLQASTIRRRTPVFWMVKSVPLTWKQRNICCHHPVPISKKNLSSLPRHRNPPLEFRFGTLKEPDGLTSFVPPIALP